MACLNTYVEYRYVEKLSYGDKICILDSIDFFF